MQIYHYSRETGEFIAASEARPDPLDEGHFLVPGGATEIKPPVAGANEIAVFDGSEWALKSDFRGVDYWLAYGNMHTITAIGETVPEGAHLTEPDEPPAPPYVPQQVTNAQGAAALIQAGLWGPVLAYVDAMEDPTEKALAEVALHRTTHWQRTSPFLNAAAASLGLSDEQLDGLFQQAAEIQL